MKNNTNPIETIRPAFLPLLSTRRKTIQIAKEMPTSNITGSITSCGNNSCIFTEYEKTTGNNANRNV